MEPQSRVNSLELWSSQWKSISLSFLNASVALQHRLCSVDSQKWMIYDYCKKRLETHSATSRQGVTLRPRPNRPAQDLNSSSSTDTDYSLLLQPLKELADASQQGSPQQEDNLDQIRDLLTAPEKEHLSPSSPTPSDVTVASSSDLILSKGYPVENHIVQTKDGFLLGVQRIPHGKAGKHKEAKGKEVVFLQHGLLSSAADWVMNFEKQSLGFILADAGYDVWLGNIRGNTYSRRHVKYTPDMAEFWNFSFDEMGSLDLPAMIDYALNISSQKQLFYVGHSQGTTSVFALLSQMPKYNKKVKLMIGLAPVATVGHMTSAIRYLTPFTKDIEFLAELLGINEFLPSNSIMKYLSELVCETKAKFICKDIIFLLCGTDQSQLNETRLGVYVAHSPAGTSTRSIVHYAQMVLSKKFLKYDFGKDQNQVHYNQSTPPEYHVENITTPVALLWSINDKLADPTDVALLQLKLKSLVTSFPVKSPLFNHLDFVWGVNASSIVYDDVLKLLRKF